MVEIASDYDDYDVFIGDSDEEEDDDEYIGDVTYRSKQ